MLYALSMNYINVDEIVYHIFALQFHIVRIPKIQLYYMKNK